MFGLMVVRHVALGSGSWTVQGPLLVHVAAGIAATVTGFVALAALKGGPLHRRTGIWFVAAMLTMGLVGAAIAAWEVKIGSVDGGLLAAYLVTTALLTVRPPSPAKRALERLAMVVALAIGSTNVALGASSALQGASTRDGVPVPVYFIFGGIALACGLSDMRIVRGAELRGAPRLARHLWRMCFALFVASASFFLGQAHLFPKALRIFPLLAAPPLLILIVMLYWLWRIRRKRAVSRLVLTAST